MFHIVLIIIFASVLLSDAGAGGEAALDLPPLEAVALGLSPLLIAGALYALAARIALRLFETGHRMTALRLTNAATVAANLIAAAWGAASILWIGMLTAVRTLVGDLLLIDEILVTLPPILLPLACWWLAFPIERRVRESLALRALETDEPIPAMPTRWRFFSDRVRHQALIFILPLYLIFAWSELLYFGILRLDAAGRLPLWLDVQLALTGAQAVGVGLIFLAAPILLRLVWRTRPLPEGPVRERLERLCRRQRIRCRGILEWRTAGEMINGAVIGLIAPLRYILLTDALLRRLPPDEIEAVLAHEMGHVRRHHMPWLLICLASVFGLSFVALSIPLRLADAWPPVANSLSLTGPDVPVTLLSVIVGLIAFGFISRRFEEQADAFAVQHLSGMKNGHAEDAPLQEDAAEAMAEALQSVARLNHIPRRRFTWRHGSIAARQRAIRRLAGQRANALRIDRVIRRIKIASALALAALLITTPLLDSSHPETPSEQATRSKSHNNDAADNSSLTHADDLI